MKLRMLNGGHQVISDLGELLSVATMAGEEGRAVIWFKHQPIPGWAGKTSDTENRQSSVRGPRFAA